MANENAGVREERLHCLELEAPTGRDTGWQPEIEIPEEGSYDWHLQRVKNASVLGWLALGIGCAEIRDGKLYLEHFQTREEFCQTELHQKASTINRQIKAAGMAIELRQAGCRQLPTCERQIRPLSLLRVLVLRIQAWNNALAMKSLGFSPTAADVLRAVRQLMPIPPTLNITNLRKLKKQLMRSQTILRSALELYNEPDVSEALVSAAGLKERRLVAKLVERNRALIGRFKVEEKILL